MDEVKNRKYVVENIKKLNDEYGIEIYNALTSKTSEEASQSNVDWDVLIDETDLQTTKITAKTTIGDVIYTYSYTHYSSYTHIARTEELSFVNEYAENVTLFYKNDCLENISDSSKLDHFPELANKLWMYYLSKRTDKENRYITEHKKTLNTMLMTIKGLGEWYE